MANRYTNITTSQYDPMSLQELMAAPSYLRKQHDDLESQASKLGIIDSNRLDVDNELVTGEIGKFEEGVGSYVDQLATEGFNPTSKRGLYKLAKQRRDLLSPEGSIGKAKKSYDAHAKNKQVLSKMYQSGKISKDKYELGIAKSLQDYTNTGGIANQGVYNDFNAVKDTDVIEKARKVALDIQRNPKILESFGLIKKGDRYYDIKTRKEYTQQGAIKFGIKNTLALDQDVMSDLNQREQLGMLGDNTASDYLNTLGSLDEVIYSKNKQTQTRRGFFDPLEIAAKKKALDKAYETKNVDFEGFVTGKQVIYDEDSINDLQRIVSGKTQIDETKYVNHGDASFLSAIADIFSGKAPKKPIVFKELSGELKTKTENIFNGLKRTGVLSENALINDKATLKAVVNYMQNNQAVVIQPNLIKHGDVLKSEKIGKDIINNASSREFYNTKTGKIMTYEDMIDKGYLTAEKNDNYKATTYRGSLGADNMYSLKVPAHARAGYITPHVLNIKGQEFLVPGSRSQLNSQKHLMDSKFNRVFQKLATQPGLPTNFQWKDPRNQKIRDVEIMRLSKTSEEYQKYGAPYLMNIDGVLKPISEGIFRRMQADLNMQN